MKVYITVINCSYPAISHFSCLYCVWKEDDKIEHGKLTIQTLHINRTNVYKPTHTTHSIKTNIKIIRKKKLPFVALPHSSTFPHAHTPLLRNALTQYLLCYFYFFLNLKAKIFYLPTICYIFIVEHTHARTLAHSKTEKGLNDE